jgi:hypothetical protein
MSEETPQNADAGGSGGGKVVPFVNPEGAKAAKRALAEAKPDSCPVTAVGHDQAGLLWFLTPHGLLRSVRPDQLMKRINLLSLMNGDERWFNEKFGWVEEENEDGQLTRKFKGWGVGKVAEFLMRACFEAGIYDQATGNVRGPGVWPLSGDGTAIVHVGDALLVERVPGELQEERIGQKIGGVIYPASAKLRRPADEPSSAEDGAALLKSLQLWKFARADSAQLLLGWMGAAMLGGLTRWRAHLALHGPQGTGKSTLLELVSATMGDAAHEARNDTSVAGLQQAFTGHSRAVIIDETENAGDEKSNAIAALIKLLRLMSSGGGASGLRGSSGGTVRSFRVVGAAIVAAILLPPLDAQDKSRITPLALLPNGLDTAGKKLPPHLLADQEARVREAVKHFHDKAPAFWRRAIEGAARFNATRALYAAEIRRKGGDNRTADQLATLLAGADLLLLDALPESEYVTAGVASLAPWLADAKETREEGHEGAVCWAHLLSTPVELKRGETKTVGDWLSKAQEKDEQGVRLLLGQIGLRLEMNRYGHALHIVIAHTHAGLARLFAGTRWAGGAWSGALGYLEGAKPAPYPVRIGGVKVRGWMLDDRHLPGAPPETDTNLTPPPYVPDEAEDGEAGP